MSEERKTNITKDLIHNVQLWQSVGYLLITLGLELLPSHKWTLGRIKEWWKPTKNLHCDNPSSYLEPLLRSSTETVAVDFDEDIDVKMERNRVLSGSVDNAIIHLRNLRKVICNVFCPQVNLWNCFTASIYHYLIVNFTHFRFILEETIMILK